MARGVPGGSAGREAKRLHGQKLGRRQGSKNVMRKLWKLYGDLYDVDVAEFLRDDAPVTGPVAGYSLGDVCEDSKSTGNGHGLGERRWENRFATADDGEG